MLSYNRGAWTDEQRDVPFENELLSPLGYADTPDINLGIPHCFDIQVYVYDDDREDYWYSSENDYFLSLAMGYSGVYILVRDYPSVLMLMKELSPVLELIYRHEEHWTLTRKHSMDREEHLWRVEEGDHEEDCEHTLD